MIPVTPRPLENAERQILDFLLELGERADVAQILDEARVAAVCECPCGSIEISTDSNKMHDHFEGTSPTEAVAGVDGAVCSILLFAEHESATLEFSWYPDELGTDQSPPPPSAVVARLEKSRWVAGRLMNFPD